MCQRLSSPKFCCKRRRISKPTIDCSENGLECFFTWKLTCFTVSVVEVPVDTAVGLPSKEGIVEQSNILIIVLAGRTGWKFGVIVYNGRIECFMAGLSLWYLEGREVLASMHAVVFVQRTDVVLVWHFSQLIVWCDWTDDHKNGRRRVIPNWLASSKQEITITKRHDIRQVLHTRGIVEAIPVLGIIMTDTSRVTGKESSSWLWSSRTTWYYTQILYHKDEITNIIINTNIDHNTELWLV